MANFLQVHPPPPSPTPQKPSDTSTEVLGFSHHHKHQEFSGLLFAASVYFKHDGTLELLVNNRSLQVIRNELKILSSDVPHIRFSLINLKEGAID